MVPTQRRSRTGRQRLVAGAALAVLVMAGVGCRSWSRGKDFGPLSAEEVEFLYLKRGVELIIHHVLIEGKPEAVLQFFLPSVRDQVDCRAFYRQVMGADPGVYQPRFWDMKDLQIQFEPDGQRARTSITIECADLTPGSGGAGRLVNLDVTWVKQAGNWFLEPPTSADPSDRTSPGQ